MAAWRRSQSQRFGATIVLHRSLLTSPASKIYLIDVASGTELRVYHPPRNPRWDDYQIYKRVASKWRVQERVVGALDSLSGQGVNGILSTGIVGTLLTLVVLIFGSLWPAIALHALVDIGSGLVAWLALRQVQGEGVTVEA